MIARETDPECRRLSTAARTAALVIAAWVAFAVFQAALMRLTGPSSGSWSAALAFHGSLAMLWAALTPFIVAWHHRVSARTRRLVWRILAHLPVAAAAALLHAVTLRAVLRAIGPAPVVPFQATAIYYADMVAVSYVAIVLAAEAVGAYRALSRRTRHTARLESQLARARLEYLDAQLQPHFLFNSLSAVSELAHESPSAAARMLQHITSLFRSALATDTDEVTLGEELLALEPYLDIQRVRFADWLTIHQDIDDRATKCLVPRLVLQPLVENAVRHGLAGRVSAGSIEIRARVEGDRLVVQVRDNGVGLREPSAQNPGKGIGLTNLRERLETLYGAGDHLRLLRDEPSTIAELSLPARDAARPSTDAIAIDEADGAADLATISNPERRYSLAPIVLTWLACGSLWTQQSVVYLHVRQRPIESLLAIVRNDMTSALLWTVLTVIVFEITARFPLVPNVTWRRTAMYVVGGMVLAATHLLALRALTGTPAPLASPMYAFAFALDVLIVWTVAAVGHRRRLLRWLHERELAAARLSNAVTEARNRAAEIRADPTVLVSTLETLNDVVRTNPATTERVLMHLGDYLRASLDAQRTDGPRHERDAALARLRTELHDAGLAAAY
jgi:two-component system sensor histidine kinase AlgZ